MERAGYVSASDRRQFCSEVSDRTKHVALLTAHKETQDRLADIFTPAFSRALERVGSVVAANSGKVSIAAYRHPLKEAPYTIFPPDFPTRLFTDTHDDPEAAIRQALPFWWRDHEMNSSEVGGLSDYLPLPRPVLMENLVEDYVASNGHPRGTEPGLWDLYLKTDAQEHEQNYATLSFLAADLSGRIRSGEHTRNPEFLEMEQRQIDKHFSYSYPTAFHQYAAPHSLSRIIRFPLSPEMDRSYDELLVRAAGFIISYLDLDPDLAADSKKVGQAHENFIRKWMLRSQDAPDDIPRVGVHSLQESVGRAVLPLLAELSRGYEPIIAKALPAFVNANLPARITAHAPLGYIGPVTLQGQGSNLQIVQWDGESKPKIHQDALLAFDDAVRDWRSDYHYKRLVEGTPDERTGLMCPFWATIVPQTARLIMYVAQNLEPQQVPDYNKNSPYQPHIVLNQMAEEFGIAA